jgi:hypothetical protein
MMYFFASQMSRNISTSSMPEQHPLDKLLSKVGIHAAFSPAPGKEIKSAQGGEPRYDAAHEVPE